MDYRPVSISSVETLRRACGRHTLPVDASSSHPWVEVGLWMQQHPRVYRFPVRSGLAPPSCLTSCVSRQVPLRFFQAAFRSHGPLLLFTVPGHALGLSLFPQLRLCVVLWYARHPCRLGRIFSIRRGSGLDRTPELAAVRCVRLSK